MNNTSSSESKYRLVAPDIDHLVSCFRHGSHNAEAPTKSILPILDELFTVFSPLAPLKKNDEAKAIWVTVPRGTIEDFGDYEEYVDDGEVENREEFEELWKSEYPDEDVWYEVVAVEEHSNDGSLRYRGVSVGNAIIVSAMMDEEPTEQDWRLGDLPDTLLKLMIPLVQNSIEKVRCGTYNEWVESSLPYQFKTGAIKRSDLWKQEPQWKETDLDGLDEQTISAFRSLISSGVNADDKIGRIKSFTTNDFFRACEIGYKAVGKETSGYSLPDLYMHYSDGRDEGLTGQGHGLNAGDGIDFSSPSAWDDWYFGKRGGGHPWEVIPGGNSTHMELFVRHDKDSLGWRRRLGEISDYEYQKRLDAAGYYFQINGKHRPFESVTFYTALSTAGLPVVLDDADEILARIDGSDYVGIVPHHVTPRYCESMFPKKYGNVIDFMHVYNEDMVKYENDITWLPEEPSRLTTTDRDNIEKARDTVRGLFKSIFPEESTLVLDKAISSYPDGIDEEQMEEWTLEMGKMSILSQAKLSGMTDDKKVGDAVKHIDNMITDLTSVHQEN